MPFYYEANAGIGMGIPGSNFPYTYYEDGFDIGAPFQYVFDNEAAIGVVHYFKTYDLSIYSQLGFGINMRFLYNNSFKHAHFGKPYFGYFESLKIGAQWKWLKFTTGVNYDSNFEFLINMSLGIHVPLDKFKLFGIGKGKKSADSLNETEFYDETDNQQQADSEDSNVEGYEDLEL